MMKKSRIVKLVFFVIAVLYLFSNYSGTPDLTINIRKREAFATLI